MKVFIDCRWLSQSGQGIVTYLSALHVHAERLLARENSQDIEFWYGVEDLSSLDSSLLPSNAQVIEIGKHSLFWRLFFFPFWLRRHAFDIAHFQYVAPIFTLGTRHVATIHDILFKSYPHLFSFSHRLPRSLLYGWTARTAACVLTVSERSADDISRLMSPRHRPIVIYNGAGMVKPNASADLESVDFLQNSRFLLTVGRVEPRKNYRRLSEAFQRSKLAQSGWRLVVVGFCDSEFFDELPSLQHTNGLHWLARVPEAQLAWLYSNATGFIYPSLCEGFGIPVLEAIDAQLPVAVSSTFPLADVVAEADERFDPTDVDEMAEAMIRLTTRDSSRCDRERLLNRYSWQSSAAKYLATLRQLAPTKQSYSRA